MLHNMKGQFAEHLMHAGFVSSRDPKDPKSNVNSGNKEELFQLLLSCQKTFLLIDIKTRLQRNKKMWFGICKCSSALSFFSLTLTSFLR